MFHVQPWENRRFYDDFSLLFTSAIYNVKGGDHVYLQQVVGRGHFHTGDNLCYFLFAILCMNPLLEKDLRLGAKSCLFAKEHFFKREAGLVEWCEGVVYLTSPGCSTDIGLQLGKASYPCSR